jgi:hypothetical protein
MKFGQIHQIFFFSFYFSLPPLQIDQVTQILANHQILLPLHCSSSITAPLSFLGWRIWGGPRQIFERFVLPSLPLTSTALDPQPASRWTSANPQDPS